ncbi:hypothetical protein KJ855_02570 [Patescibacteria group bacterium]|nr:hypothetical protein [Patescibacteria group bacterium]
MIEKNEQFFHKDENENSGVLESFCDVEFWKEILNSKQEAIRNDVLDFRNRVLRIERDLIYTPEGYQEWAKLVEEKVDDVFECWRGKLEVMKPIRQMKILGEKLKDNFLERLSGSDDDIINCKVIEGTISNRENYNILGDYMELKNWGSKLPDYLTMNSWIVTGQRKWVAFSSSWQRNIEMVYKIKSYSSWLTNLNDLVKDRRFPPSKIWTGLNNVICAINPEKQEEKIRDLIELCLGQKRYVA